MNISNEIISLEEAKTALKCMRLCSLNEVEALESVDSLVGRIRKISTAKLLEEIIENRLSETQRRFIKEYWYNQKNTAQIARETGVSQANVYRTLARANETIKELLTPLVIYYNDLADVQLVPLYIDKAFEISAAKNSKDFALCARLKNIRLSNSVTLEDLAQVMCITVKEIKDIEDGIKAPTVEVLQKYSKFFGIEIDVKFINGKGRYEWREA